MYAWRFQLRPAGPIVSSPIRSQRFTCKEPVAPDITLREWAVGTAAGTWMFVAADLTPKFPLAIGGYTFPGYSALYTVILNLLVTIVLTPVFNALGSAQT